LQSAQFNTNIHQAGNRVRGFREEVKSSTTIMSSLQSGLRSVATIVAAAGAAAAGAAVVGFSKLREEMRRIDEIGKMAGKLGIATEAFVGLSHGAHLSGIELTALQTSLTKMTRGLSEAAIRGGPVDDVLRELGLSSKTLADMTPNDALYKLADALTAVENPMDRVRIAQAIFGRAGADMITMLQGGSAALAEMQREASRLGMVFSEGDFRQVEYANDAMARLKESTGALKRALAIELAPTIATIADNMTDWLTTSNTGARAAAESIGGIVSAGASVVDVFRQIQVHWAATVALLIRGTKDIVEVLAMIPEPAKFLVPELNLLPDDEFLKNMAGGLQQELNLYNQMVNRLEGEDWGQGIRDQVARLKADLRGRAGSPVTMDLVDLEALEQQQKTMEDLRRKAEAMEVALRTPQEALTSRIVDANKLLNLGAIGWQTYTREIAAARSEFQRLQNEISQFSQPSLLEEGTQAFYAAVNKWENQQERMQGPLPGADLVMTEPPRPIGERIAEAQADLARQRAALLTDMQQWMVNHPIPGPDSPPRNVVRVTPTPIGDAIPVPRIYPPEYRQRVSRGLPVDGAEDFRGGRGGSQVEEHLQEISKKLDEIPRVTGETSRTTEASRRTASAVERMELPVTVEF